MKAHELAPGVFTWKKYKSQIDRQAIYKHLWDQMKADNGGEYVVLVKNDGWMLTLSGTEFARGAVANLKSISPAVKKKKQEPWVGRERVRMLGETAYAKYAEGRKEEIALIDAEKLFRLDDYVIGEARERKVRQAENAFHDDPDLGPVITIASALVRRQNERNRT
jgi:hypothetical protein